MIQINPTVLAFYDNVSKQSHKLSYAYGNIFSLIAPVNKFLPFQIILPSNTAALSSARVVSLETGVSTTVTSHFSSATLTNYTDYKVFRYNGTGTLGSNLTIGLHYIELSFGSLTMYSEVFNALQVVSAENTIQIAYWDRDDFIFRHTLGRLEYPGAYQNKIYVPSALAKPEYRIEEVVEDRDGFKFVEKQIQKKVYRFSFLAPEYLCDVLSLVPLHDSVVITYRDKIMPVYDILFTPSWTSDGFLANVDVEFTTEAIVKKIGKVFPTRSLGDFNNDFGSDFSVI